VTLSSVLTTGVNGLNAASHGTAVASQNVSNAATPGYTRRVTNQQAIPLQYGGGVSSQASTRVQDAYLQRRSLVALAYSGDTAARADTLSVIDTTFGDTPGSLGQALASFQSSVADLSTNASDTAARQTFLASASQLTQAFNRASADLSTARVDANGRISQAVAAVDGKLDAIAKLGGQIVLAKAQGQEYGDLADRRDQLVRDVASALPVSTSEDPTGAMTLTFSGSRTLVSPDGTVHPLQASLDTTTGDVHIFRTTSGAQEDVTSMITGGTIGGSVAARDGALADARSSLDQLASDVTGAYNLVHRAGVGLDGVTGRNLFTPLASVSGAAASMSVSSDVAGQPRNVGAALAPGSLPGDNRNALALAGLASQPFASAGTATADAAYGALVASGGTALRQALDQQGQAQTAQTQLDNLRSSVSGVSTDDEMVSLMQYQRSYQASMRVVETADAMLGELLNMRGP
jgi:flagellar hook-associated protein 1 FlgK